MKRFDAQSAARFYRSIGWQPLPSQRYAKRPALPTYAEYFTDPVSDVMLDGWEAPNIQLVCGVRWNLGVVDLDGELAAGVWQSWTIYKPAPMTWMARTGSGGLHLYYRLPHDLESFPRRTAWKGGHHQQIDILGDHSLVIAPPSRHVDPPHRPYRWLVGPRDLERPAVMPQWVVDLHDWNHRETIETFRPTVPAPIHSDPISGHYDRRDVLNAISDKRAVAESWGLRFVGGRTLAGWLRCRAIGREDRHASAGFNERSGYYVEPFIRRMSLFELGAALGRFADWVQCCNALGSIYLA